MFRDEIHWDNFLCNTRFWSSAVWIVIATGSMYQTGCHCFIDKWEIILVQKFSRYSGIKFLRITNFAFVNVSNKQAATKITTLLKLTNLSTSCCITSCSYGLFIIDLRRILTLSIRKARKATTVKTLISNPGTYQIFQFFWMFLPLLFLLNLPLNNTK